MSDKYITYQQHEPLRVPEGWNMQEKKFVGQLEEILDDIYRRFGRLSLEDFDSKTRKIISNEDGIDLSTGEKGQIVSRVGEDIELLIDKEGITGKKGVFESLEAPNIVTCFEGGNAPWMGTIQATIDALPKYLKAETFITIPEGTYNESLNIMGFMGAPLNLINAEDEKVTIIGQISAKHCSNWLRIQATVAGLFEIYPPAGNNVYNSTVIAQNIGLLSLWRLMISGYRNPTSSTRTTSGINLSGCKFAVQDTCVEYTFRAILIGDGSSGTIADCYGGGTNNYNMNGIGVIPKDPKIFGGRFQPCKTAYRFI